MLSVYRPLDATSTMYISMCTCKYSQLYRHSKGTNKCTYKHNQVLSSVWQDMLQLPCKYQKLTHPSIAIYKPHMPISSCAHMRQLCQYIYLIIEPNAVNNVTRNTAYISDYCKMPLNKNASHIIHIITYITHIWPTALLLWSTYIPHITTYKSKKQTNYNYFLPCYNSICPNTKYYPQMLYICHICQLFQVHIWDNYIPHMNSMHLMM